jgi:uncharacterized protein YuzE
METRFDKSTDSLYVEVRPLPSARKIELEDDIVLDPGEDGLPAGYDIQQASTEAERIGRLILDQHRAAE